MHGGPGRDRTSIAVKRPPVSNRARYRSVTDPLIGGGRRSRTLNLSVTPVFETGCQPSQRHPPTTKSLGVSKTTIDSAVDRMT